jgi:hypothetical protein
VRHGYSATLGSLHGEPHPKLVRSISKDNEKIHAKKRTYASIFIRKFVQSKRYSHVSGLPRVILKISDAKNGSADELLRLEYLSGALENVDSEKLPNVRKVHIIDGDIGQLRFVFVVGGDRGMSGGLKA